MDTFLNRAAPRAVFNRYLTRFEERRLLAHIAKHAGDYARRDHAWIRLMIYTGLRLGSVRGLTVADAYDALGRGVLRAAHEHTKGGRGYDVDLNAKSEQALRDLLKVRRGMGLPDDEAGPLICSRLGMGLSERSFQMRIQGWGREARIGVACSPHWLRHTAARRILERTEAADPLGAVQVALGHSSRQSTTVYALPTREEVRRSMQLMCR